MLLKMVSATFDQSGCNHGNTPFSITKRTPHGEQRWTVLIRQLSHFNDNTPHSEQLRTILIRQLFTRKLVQAVYRAAEG